MAESVSLDEVSGLLRSHGLTPRISGPDARSKAGFVLVSVPDPNVLASVHFESSIAASGAPLCAEAAAAYQADIYERLLVGEGYAVERQGDRVLIRGRSTLPNHR